MSGDKRVQITNCIIVGAGDFSGFVSAPDREKDLIIAADGGMNYLAACGVMPDIWIGDADSLEVELPECTQIVRLPKEKDETDMLAAALLALKAGCKTFHIYGGCGGRLDHTLANIALLDELSSHDATAYMYDKSSMMTVIRDGGISFPEGLSGMISIFSLADESKGITIRGLKYEIEDYNMKRSDSIGTSNEFVGRSAFIEVKSGALLIVMS